MHSSERVTVTSTPGYSVLYIIYIYIQNIYGNTIQYSVQRFIYANSIIWVWKANKRLSAVHKSRVYDLGNGAVLGKPASYFSLKPRSAPKEIIGRLICARA